MSISLLYISESEVAQSCSTLCDPVDCSLPDFSVHGILQARILEWVSIPFSRGSSRPRNWTWVSRIGGRRFNLWATREAHKQSPNLEAHDTIIINLKDVLNRRKNKEEEKRRAFWLQSWGKPSFPTCLCPCSPPLDLWQVITVQHYTS